MKPDALLERVSALSERAAERDADYKRRNRELMPETAAIIDGLRAVGISPAWGKFKENGRTVEFGERSERYVPPIPHLVTSSGVAGLLTQWMERHANRRKSR